MVRRILGNCSPGTELAVDFYERMRVEKKPAYLPWGIPTADRNTFAELGDMILLGATPGSPPSARV